MPRFGLPLIVLLATALLLAPLAQAGAAGDPLDVLGLNASAGAAPGYLPDAACARCHADMAESFAEVGMAQAFARPDRARRVEDFDRAAFHHAASGRHYRLHWRGEELWFERFRLDAAGVRVDAIELRVDWVMGSGNRARSYLHQTEAGELYQLPIGWYSEAARFDMSPGFEAADHAGVERLVQRECLFCHNAYPEVPVGNDLHQQPHLFPTDLPEGIGCQRCHGPGAAHVRAVVQGEAPAAIRAAIVNPARLEPRRRDEVCFQCHLLPAVEAIGPRRMGRGDYSFRPGEALGDYLVHVEIEDPRRPRAERFQINHHAYRLSQSACYIRSEGRLGCIGCHDPHRKQTGGRDPEHFIKACLGCHEPHAADDPALAKAAADTGESKQDCIACHMPRRRTQDVVLATMTDHRIARGPFDHAQLVAPLQPVEPLIEGLRLWDPGAVSAAGEAEAYRALAALRAGAGDAALQHLERQLATISGADPGWWFELARHAVAQGRFDGAIEALDRLGENPAFPRAAGLRAHALLGLGRGEAAARLLEQVVAADPSGFNPETHYNLGLVRRAAGDLPGARAAFRIAVGQRPLFALGWYQLGRTAELGGDATGAREAYRRALSINPDMSAVREALHALEEDAAGRK